MYQECSPGYHPPPTGEGGTRRGRGNKPDRHSENTHGRVEWRKHPGLSTRQQFVLRRRRSRTKFLRRFAASVCSQGSTYLTVTFQDFIVLNPCGGNCTWEVWFRPHTTSSSSVLWRDQLLLHDDRNRPPPNPNPPHVVHTASQGQTTQHTTGRMLCTRTSSIFTYLLLWHSSVLLFFDKINRWSGSMK